MPALLMNSFIYKKNSITIHGFVENRKSIVTYNMDTDLVANNRSLNLTNKYDIVVCKQVGDKLIPIKSNSFEGGCFTLEFDLKEKVLLKQYYYVFNISYAQSILAYTMEDILSGVCYDMK